MTQKHTPAPWGVTTLKAGFRIEGVRDGGLSYTVAMVADINRYEQNKANAQLIAAAPDLLGECKKQVAWLRHIKSGVNLTPAIEMGFEQSIKYLSAAINQAEGK